VVEKLIALGVLVYAGTGLATTLIGRAKSGHAIDAHSDHAHGEQLQNVPANFLDYEALNHDVLHGFLPHGQHLGIFLIELGVGITVTAVMIMIFYCFAGRSDLFDQEHDRNHPDAKHQESHKGAQPAKGVTG
jgi:multicomponent Na+:H+ antiporter subunit B